MQIIAESGLPDQDPEFDYSNGLVDFVVIQEEQVDSESETTLANTLVRTGGHQPGNTIQ